MINYPTEAYDKLCAAVRREAGSEDWLKRNYPELSAFWDAIEGMERQFQWLMKNGHPELAAVVDAMNGNSQAKKWLLLNRYKQLAAFVDAAEGQQGAVSFLLQHQEHGLAKFAKALYEKDKKEEKNFFKSLLNFGNPFR
jgi:hypothetical protein